MFNTLSFCFLYILERHSLYYVNIARRSKRFFASLGLFLLYHRIFALFSDLVVLADFYVKITRQKVEGGIYLSKNIPFISLNITFF